MGTRSMPLLRPLLAVTLFLSCFLSGTQGFFPSDWREKYFGGGGVSHEAQTRIAFDTLAEKYFPDISPITANMIKARTTMAEANMKVDDDQTSSAKHFDGENFDGGQALLVQAKTNVIEALRNGNGEAARNFLGAALHTLQDFYAHTNWVELGNSDINYDLGKEGRRLSLITFAQQTCNECGFGGVDRLLRGCHDCTTNTNGFNLLTSGYYEGEDVPPGDTEIPDWKCRHGGATDSAFGAVAGAISSSALRDVTPGINKDSLNCFWSPHHFHHVRAADLASKSSIQYIEDIIAEGPLEDKERKLLFGVGTSLAFAIDTTGSMASIIAATRDQAIAIARGRLGTKDEPIDYIVAPFNDPSTGPVSKVTDFDAFVASVNTLSASGGGDCPELAISGILDALAVMEGPSDLFIMTDANAKDFDLAPRAIEIAFEKQIRFHVFKFDSFCDDGAASKKRGLERRADSVANEQYSFICASTGGTYHSLPTSEAGSISSLLDSLTLSESNTVLKLSGTLDATSSFEVPVDSRMTEFTISLRGEGVTLSLTKPDGSALDLSSTGVTLTTVTDGQFLNVKSPASGVWSLTLNLAGGSATFSCDVSGVSPLHLSRFNFVALSGRPGHKGYFALPTQPAYDHDVAAVAYLDGAFDSAVFDLRDALAVHAVDTNMEQGTGAEGAPPRNSFYGEMRLINQPLYAYVEGTDDTGAPFQRVLASVFQPFLSGTNETGFNSTDIFAGINNNTNISSSSSSSSHASTGTTLPPYSTGNTTLVPYPTPSSSSKSKGHYYSGYPVPVYTWDHETYEPTKTGGGDVKTHTKYATPGCDKLEPSTYVTTSTYTVSEPTKYVTETTVTVTTYVPVLCATCTGENYPHHTGKGPWYEEDKSVIESGYGDYVTTVDYTPYETKGNAYDTEKVPTATKKGYEAYPSESKASYEAYPSESKAGYGHYSDEHSTSTPCSTSASYKTKGEEESYPTSVKYDHSEETHHSSSKYNHDVESYPTSIANPGHGHGHGHDEHKLYTSGLPYASSVPYGGYSGTPDAYPPASSKSPEAYPSIPVYESSKAPEVYPSSPVYESSKAPEAYPSSAVESYTPAPPAYTAPPAPPADTPVHTATVPAPGYSMNVTVELGGNATATASEYSVPEFTGGAEKLRGGAMVGVVVGAVAGLFLF